MINKIKNFWTRSITQQLILGIALVHAVLMTIFVFDLVNRQSEFLKEQSEKQTLGLTQTLAANSVSWVLSRDFMGMEEIINSQEQQPNLVYAMILAPSGEVLSHTQNSNVGLFVNDTISLSLLAKEHISQILIENNSLIDIASPIFANDKFIGWARVGMSQKVISDGLATITKDGIWYTILAIIIGSIFAIIMGRGITLGLRHLVAVADEIRDGNENIRISLKRKDELGKLGLNLNAMIDSIIMQKNITKETQKELIVAKVFAEKANEAKSLFLASMSHELRTPLNGILGFTQLFKKDKSLLQKQREGIEIIHNSAEHLLQLVNDILDYTRMEVDKLEIIKTDFNLDEFLHTITQIIAIQASGKSLIFDYQHDLLLPKTIFTDKVRLRQILLNLLKNAVKFTDAGSVKLVVSCGDTSPNSSEATIKFEIIDSGDGIAPDMHEKIFETFNQGNNSKLFIDGTGLGLSISRKLINLLDGELYIESPIYKTIDDKRYGSKFYFELKVQVVESQTEVDNNYLSNFTTFRVKGEKQTLKILIVDDRETNRIVLRQILVRFGFKVFEASSGRQATELCKSNDYNLIFLDILLPDADGFEIAKRIRLNSDKQIPIIALSSLVDVLDRTKSKSIEAGFNDVISKPFYEKDIFLALIENLPIEPVFESELTSNYEQEINVPNKEILQVILELSQEGDIGSLNTYISFLKTQESGKYLAFSNKINAMSENFKFEEIENFIYSKIDG